MKRPTHFIVQSLREVRLRRGWSLNELGRRAGYTGNHIWNLENGKINPKFMMVVDIAQALGLNIELKGPESET